MQPRVALHDSSAADERAASRPGLGPSRQDDDEESSAARAPSGARSRPDCCPPRSLTRRSEEADFPEPSLYVPEPSCFSCMAEIPCLGEVSDRHGSRQTNQCFFWKLPKGFSARRTPAPRTLSVGPPAQVCSADSLMFLPERCWPLLSRVDGVTRVHAPRQRSSPSAPSPRHSGPLWRRSIGFVHALAVRVFSIQLPVNRCFASISNWLRSTLFAVCSRSPSPARSHCTGILQLPRPFPCEARFPSRRSANLP